MGDSGSQTLGFALAALGLTSSWRVAGTTVATLILPVLVLAVPILDTALVTILRLLDGRHLAGRPRPLLAPARPLRPLREARGRAARADRARHRRLEPRLQRARQLPLHGDRRRPDLALLIQFASFLADVDRRPASASGRADAGLRRPLAPPGRGARRLPADHGAPSSPPTRSCSAGRARRPALHPRSSRSGHPRRALPDVHPVRPLPLGLAVRRPPRRGRRSPPRSSSPRSIALVFMVSTQDMRTSSSLLRRRRAHLHRRGRRLAVRRAADRRSARARCATAPAGAPSSSAPARPAGA